jgi:hypothetical protein
MAGLPPTLEQFYLHGPGPEVWEPLARRAAEIDVATNRIRLPAHGLGADHPLTLTPGADQFGDEGTLPAGLSKFAVYYARPVASSLLELASTPGGAAIDFGPDPGTGGLYVERDLAPMIEQWLSQQTSKFIACANKNEWIEPPDGWGGDVAATIMDLAAWPALDAVGYRSPEGERDGYRQRYLLAVDQMKRWCSEDEVPAGATTEDGGDLGEQLSSSWDENIRGWTPLYPEVDGV